ncbi:MAG TPA: hypothetical protein VFO16_15155 [Pseudonocardiaceae bacterium]|nr:hypothetical protein [Pseudonocardiaceae bacterium]
MADIFPIPDQNTITEIVRAADKPDDVVNREITLGYHQLSEAIRHELGAEDSLDWCGFAKWSSHTVGLDLNPHLVGAEIDELAGHIDQWIEEFLPDDLVRAADQPVLETAFLIGEALRPGFLAQHFDGDLLLSALLRSGRLSIHTAAGLFPPAPAKKALHFVIVELLKRASDVDDHLGVRALRFGNIAIFRDMGSIFSQMVTDLRDPKKLRPKDDKSDTDFAKGVVDTMLASPRRTPPTGLSLELLRPPTPQEQDMLADGIKLYLQASREPDAAHRDELMLAGSMRFSMYEQARADRLIAIGINAPVRTRLLPIVRALSAQPVSDDDVMFAGPEQDDPVIRGVVRTVAEKLTGLALVVKIAGTTVKLGHPDDPLLTPQVTPTLDETKRVMAEVTLPAGLTPNWTDLNYRLGFIGRYFAAFQKHKEAFQQPDAPA